MRRKQLLSFLTIDGGDAVSERSPGGELARVAIEAEPVAMQMAT